MNLLVLTVFEIIYLFYMFILFKTKINLNHPYEYYITNNLSDFFKHPIENNVYGNKICPFGKVCIILLIFLIVLRYLFINQYSKSTMLKYLNILIIILSLLFSLLNMNALLYIIPFIIIEILIINKSLIYRIN